MKFQDLKRSFADVACPIYLLEGEDAFFRERSVKLIKDKFLSQPDFNYSVYEGSLLKEIQEEVLSALRSYPFMSDKRVVLIRDYYPTAVDAKNGKGIMPYLDNPVDETILIIANSAKSDVLKKHKNVTVVDCSKGDMAIIAMWVKNRLAKDGFTATSGTVETISDYCLGDMTRISSETEKLISFCSGKTEITPEDVSAIVTKEADYRIYEFVEYVAKGLYDKAYGTLFDLLDKNTDKQKLFVSIYMHFRRLLFVSISEGTASQIADRLGVKEYAVIKAKEQAKYFSPVRLKSITEELGKYDAGFKSGKVSLDDVLWNSVFSILVGSKT